MLTLRQIMYFCKQKRGTLTHAAYCNSMVSEYCSAAVIHLDLYIGQLSSSECQVCRARSLSKNETYQSTKSIRTTEVDIY